VAKGLAMTTPAAHKEFFTGTSGSGFAGRGMGSVKPVRNRALRALPAPAGNVLSSAQAGAFIPPAYLNPGTSPFL